MDSMAYRGRHGGEWVAISVRPPADATDRSSIVVTVEAVDISTSSHVDDDAQVSIHSQSSNERRDNDIGDMENDPLLIANDELSITGQEPKVLLQNCDENAMAKTSN